MPCDCYGSNPNLTQNPKPDLSVRQAQKAKHETFKLVKTFKQNNIMTNKTLKYQV